MKKYLIAGSTDIEIEEGEGLCVVNAENLEEAKEKYIRVVIKEEDFLDYAYDPSCNMGFAERLYYDKKGKYVFDECGEPKYTEEMIVKFVKKNIKDLFKENEEWQMTYLDFLMNYDDEKEYNFCNEMLEIMYKNSWGNDIIILEIGKDIKEI